MRRLTAALAFAVLAIAASASAADQTQQRPGITISPPFQQLTLQSSGDTPIAFQLTNGSKVSQTLNVAPVDFKSLDESGGVVFSGTSSSGKYALSKWMTLDKSSVTLGPGESATVGGHVSNRPDLSPGGHYGAVLVTLSSPASLGTGTKVGLKQVAASLVFTIKTGGERYQLAFDKVPDLPKQSFSVPETVKLRFHNQGNVQVVPRGIVTVLDPRGHIVAKGTINDGTSIVLPESYRQLVTTLQRQELAWVPGTYRLKVQYRYESSSTLQIAEAKMVVVPWPAVFALVVLLAIIITLMWAWRTGRRRRKA